MAENKESVVGELEILAKITDELQKMYRGRATVIFELEEEEYTKSLNMFNGINKTSKQFKIEISGSDFIFILIS